MRWGARKSSNEDLSKRFVAWSDSDSATGEEAPRQAPERPSDLQAAREAARQRYAAIAAALKAEAGVTRHYEHKVLGGLAWSAEGKILAPEGVTRRQLYVLAHECGHVVLHGTPDTWTKPGHVKEHEAEVYAHRSFKRYGIEVPAKSAHWARAYVGQWIMKDKLAGLPICPMATEFALGRRSPHDPLPSVDGQPPQDFSKHLDRFVAKGMKLVEKVEQQSPSVLEPKHLAPPALLSFTEGELFDELNALARKLDRKRVAGAFAALADVTEQVDRVKQRDVSAVPVIVRGMDRLRKLEQEHRSARRQRVKYAISRRDEAGTFAIVSLVAAAASLMAWMAGTGDAALYAAGFFFVLAPLIASPIIVDILTD